MRIRFPAIALLIAVTAVALSWRACPQQGHAVRDQAVERSAPMTNESGIHAAPGASPDPESIPSRQARLDVARRLILETLSDPPGVRFRNERVLQAGEIVCIEVDADGEDGAGGFTAAIVILRPDRAPSIWIDRGLELVAHTACEVA